MADQSAPILSVNNIEVVYNHVVLVLKGMSLQVQEGSIVALLGSNGAGKSTTLKAISGFLPLEDGEITDGRILFEGEELAGYQPHHIVQKGIFQVMEGRRIFEDLTVEENLRCGYAALPRDRRRIEAEIFELFPVLKDMLRRRGGDLSGGQQQQLAIARALVMRPRLLVLDEPTEGIQPSIIKDIERVIRLLAGRGDMAIVLVEQYFEFARDLADSYAVMDRGEVVLAGRAAEMVEADVRRSIAV